MQQVCIFYSNERKKFSHGYFYTLYYFYNSKYSVRITATLFNGDWRMSTIKKISIFYFGWQVLFCLTGFLVVFIKEIIDYFSGIVGDACLFGCHRIGLMTFCSIGIIVLMTAVAKALALFLKNKKSFSKIILSHLFLALICSLFFTVI